VLWHQFRADGHNQVWVADIPYVPTCSGFLCLAVIVDFYGRRAVGWCMAPHLRGA
jgi:putative transposase